MTFQSNPDIIHWKSHLKSSPQAVYQKLSTDEGRASFWAESAVEEDGVIHFIFPNQAEWKGRILEKDPPHKFKVEYYGGSMTTFELESDGSSGTDLTLTDQGVPRKTEPKLSQAGCLSLWRSNPALILALTFVITTPVGLGMKVM